MKLARMIPILISIFASVSIMSAQQNPLVLIQTDLGNITVEIFEQKAPRTAANFLRYVDENRYRGATFYRVYGPENQPGFAVKISAIEGGLRLDDRAKRFPPVVYESTKRTGVRHLDGTITMIRARSGEVTSEFLLCIGDQPSLDGGGPAHPDGRGFAAFGRVVKGMDIVRKIQQMPADGQILIQKVKILEAVRLVPPEPPVKKITP